MVEFGDGCNKRLSTNLIPNIRCAILLVPAWFDDYKCRKVLTLLIQMIDGTSVPVQVDLLNCNSVLLEYNSGYLLF